MGVILTRGRNLEAIARGLEVSVRELLQPAIELRNVRFRSHKELRTRRQILTGVGRWLTDYNAFEEIVEARRPFRLRGLSEEAVGGQERPVIVARMAGATLGLTADEPIRDVCGLLDSAGVKVFPKPVASDGFFGLSVGPSDGGPAVVVNTWARRSVERWIFSAAHELGHLLLHLDD